ncbi:hypothetical protein F5Y03DRAFT_151335 [Xylaria venustula]|nr:hypothetical protein F5Y03DRAFT_151335 [Xylaria venustula]
MVRRFLIYAFTADVVPTLIDWVRSARAYGMALVRDSPAQGAINWDGDEVIYYDIRFYVKALRDALYRFVGKTKALLCEKLLFLGDINREAFLPFYFSAIDWANLQDNAGNSMIGHFFFRDARNDLVFQVDGAPGGHWLLDRITSGRYEALRA